VRVFSRLGHRAVVGVICLWSLFPIYWALNTSLMNSGDAQAIPAHYLPIPITVANYQQLLGLKAASTNTNTASTLWPQFSQAFTNSMIECIAATLITVTIAVFSAYAFARMAFRFKTIVFYLVIGTMALPAYATLIPLYRILGNAGLVNTYTGIVLVYVSGFLPLAMWILYSYFAGVPRELEDAALVDGSSTLGVLFRIMIPVARPGITAAAIITFLSAWGQFLFPLVLASDATTQPLTVMITSLQSEHVVPYTLINATGILCIIVPAVMVAFLNRFIISGILAGSVK
jgi:multiple sugar transport system permease protein